jgi:hypothetical protein
MEETVVNGGATSAGLILVQLVMAIVMLVAWWKVFTKAGQPGWAILVPFFNAYVMLKIAGKPGWWLFLMLIPIVNIVTGIMVLAGLAGNFGKGVGFVAGLIFLPIIFYPMLAFGSAEYQAATE